MLDNSRREKVLLSLRCVLSNIQSGLLIEACTAFPDPQFILMDGMDSVDGWIPSGEAINPTLYTGSDVPKPPAAMNMGKAATGVSAHYQKIFAAPFDATDMLGFAFIYVEDTSLLHNTQALNLRIGTDVSNFYEITYNKISFTNQEWTEINFDFDEATPTGNPDRTSIQYVRISWRAPTTITEIPLGNVKVDWLSLFNEFGWLPGGGANVPELNSDNPVVGLYSVAFGKIANADDVFAISKTLETPIDGTGGDLEAWVYVYDKTKLTSVPPSGYSIGILVGDSSLAWWAKFLFEDELLDVINDRTNGWNQIQFNPITEYDLKAGDPDISAVSFVGIGGIAISEAIEIPTEEIKTDYWRFSEIDGLYNNDVKEVYRYAIGSYQTHGSPSIMFSMLREIFVSNIYPIITSTMLVSLDGEIELPVESVLDKELGKLASDIQVALATNQSLFGHANYVEIKNVEFSVKEGTSHGYVVMLVEIGYDMNQKDPTEDGL